MRPIHNILDFKIRWILEGVPAKNLEATLLFVDFSKAFDSIHRGKIQQIVLTYGLSKETVTAIIKKRKVRSLTRDRFLWKCSWCSERGYISFIYVHKRSRQRTSNVNRSNKIIWFYTKKKKRQEAEDTPAQTITDPDFTYDVVFLENIPTQAEFLQHSLEQSAGGISFHVNADKKEHMCFNQEGDISLKLLEKFTYLGGSVSSTEKDISMRLA